MSRYFTVALACLALSGCMEGRKETHASRTLYERIGGGRNIAAVVDDLVANVVADPKIEEAHKKHFREGDVAGLKERLTDQVAEATRGPRQYSGKEMKTAHKGLGITDADFDALVVNLIKALDKNHVGQADKDELLGILSGMRKDIVEK